MELFQASDPTQCKQCGICCRKGGPALHYEDLEFWRRGHIGCEHLVTVRKGELAYDPASDGLVPTSRELVKVKGTGGEWTCVFYAPATATCSIYDWRPLECRLLKCWDTADLLAVVGRDTICRRDLLVPDDPSVALIELHEKRCPAEQVQEAVALWQRNKEDHALLIKLTELVRQDLIVRHQAVISGGLPEALEFFLLGRPVFKLLAPLGIALLEVHGDIELQYQP